MTMTIQLTQEAGSGYAPGMMGLKIILLLKLPNIHGHRIS